MPEDHSRRYRVLARTIRGDTESLVLVDLTPTDDPADAYEPVAVRASDYEDTLAERVAELEPGYVVAATLDWTGADAGTAAAFDTLTVERRTRYRFAADVEGMFEAARETWEAARTAGEAMNSRVTRDTDGEPNGALYVFADPSARNMFEEFQSGRRPIEPLVERVNEQHTESTSSGGVATAGLTARLEQTGEDAESDGTESADETAETDNDGPPEREVFVLSPADGTFVVVYIAFEKDGLLATTMRDTYEELAE
jgi:hypothetical protein